MSTPFVPVVSPHKIAAPYSLDAKYQVDDIAARDAIPLGERYEGMQVFVLSDHLYILIGGIGNGNWNRMAYDLSQINIISNDTDVLSVTSPSIQDNVFLNPITNVGNGSLKLDSSARIPTGFMISDRVAFTSQSGLSSTEVRSALDELKLITDGLVGGVNFVGTFDPANPPANPPTDGDTVNFTTGDLFVVTVAGFWNFTTGDQSPDGGGDNVANLLVGDNLIANPGIVWEVVPSVQAVTSVNGKTGAVVLDTDDIAEGAVNLYYTEARVSANVDVVHSNRALLDSLTDAGPGTNYLADDGTYKAVSTLNVAGTVTGAVQLRNAGGTDLDADDQFFYSSGSLFNDRVQIGPFNVAVRNSVNNRISGNLTTDNGDNGSLYLYQSPSGSTTLIVRLTASPGVVNYINNGGNFGIGTVSPTVKFEVISNDAIRIPSGNDAQRPSVGTNTGYLRYNSDQTAFEGFNGTDWVQFSEGTLPAGTREGAVQLRNVDGTAFNASDDLWWEDTRKTLTAQRAGGVDYTGGGLPYISCVFGEDVRIIGGGTGTFAWCGIFGSTIDIDNGGTFRNVADCIISGTGNVIRIANGAFGIFSSMMWGSGNLIEPGQSGNYVYTLIGGEKNTSRNGYQVLSGQNIDASGVGAFGHGDGTDTEKIFIGGSFAGVLCSSTNSAQTVGHGANASNSFILASINGDIPSDSGYSVIIGGKAIKARAATPYMTYLSNMIVGEGLEDDSIMRVPLSSGVVTAGEAGLFRFNTATNTFQGHDNTGWTQIGGGVNFDVRTLTFTGGVLTLYPSARIHVITLQADVTTIEVTEDGTPTASGGTLATDYEIILIFVQDSTGGHNVQSWGGIKSVDGATPDLTLDANGESFFNIGNYNNSSYLFGAGKLLPIA